MHNHTPKLSALIAASALAAFAPNAAAQSNDGIARTASAYANERTLSVNGENHPVAETSARLFVSADGKTPLLVDDIFEGKGNKATPGYRLMVINRTSSIYAEAGKSPDGRVTDRRVIHRGSKALIGIPVVNGKARLDQAELLNLDVIKDQDESAAPPAEGGAKARGSKMTKRGAVIDNKRVRIRSLTFPNIASGENAGGGIDFEASATVDGKQVATSANSAFQIFYTAKPRPAAPAAGKPAEKK